MYPFTIKEDNEGTIKLANSTHASRRTRHIDIKHDSMEGPHHLQHAGIQTNPSNLKTFAEITETLMHAKLFN